VGAAFASRNTPWSRLALSYASGFGATGPASYWLSDRKGRVQDCVFANSILVQSAYLDDGPHHLSVVPTAAIAVAEAEGRSGADILAAIAVGYEIAFRIQGEAMAADKARRGLRSASPMWNFASAATAAYLMALPASQIADALALTAGALVNVGNYQVLANPGVHTSERVLQNGAAGRDGVFAAELARAGFTGVDLSLEGEHGFYYVWTSGNPEPPPKLLAELGQKWHMDDVSLKPGGFGTAGSAGYAIYAALKLVRDHAVKAEDIVSVEIETLPGSPHMGGVNDPGPFKHFEQAVTSIQCAVAIALVFGKYDVASILKGVGNSRVDAIGQHTRVTARKASTAKLDGRFDRVTVQLRNGNTLTMTAEDMPQSMMTPTWDEMVARFHMLTEDSLSSKKRNQIVTNVQDLDQAADCRALVELLRQTG